MDMITGIIWFALTRFFPFIAAPAIALIRFRVARRKLDDKRQLVEVAGMYTYAIIFTVFSVIAIAGSLLVILLSSPEREPIDPGRSFLLLFYGAAAFVTFLFAVFGYGDYVLRRGQSRRMTKSFLKVAVDRSFFIASLTLGLSSLVGFYTSVFIP